MTEGSADFSLEETTRLEPGVSTKDDVEALLGDPTDTRHIDEGTDLWTFDRKDLAVRGGVVGGGPPLINVLTAGLLAPSSKLVSHVVCQIIFKDGILDSVEVIELDKDGNRLGAPEEQSLAAAFKKRKDGNPLPGEEKITLVASASRSDDISTRINFQELPLVFTTFEFDLSQLPEDIEVSEAVLHAFARSKMFVTARGGMKGLPAPKVFLMRSLEQEYSVSGFGLPAVDCGSKLSLSPRSLPSSLVAFWSVMNPSFVYTLAEPSWDTWVVTSYVRKALSLVSRRVYLMLGNEWATRPRSQLPEDFSTRASQSDGWKFPLGFEYYTRDLLATEGKSNEFVPYLDVFFRNKANKDGAFRRGGASKDEPRLAKAVDL